MSAGKAFAFLNKKLTFIYEDTYHIAWSIVDPGYVFFGACFQKKRAFCLLAPPKHMSFLTISNGNVFLKTQDTRLGAIVASDKGLEYNRP